MERNLEYLLEKCALEEALLKYCTAVDKLSDIEFMLSCFTEDAVFDLGGLQLPRYVGHRQIAAFFTQVFADMSHHAHLVTNFRIESLQKDTADVQAYITGLGRSKAGIDIQVYVRYDLKLRKTSQGWKIAVFGEAPIMPMPDSVLAVHDKS
jgi:ketosteroid isomerase-like protein